ncbi:NAD-dependent epimerase/dehydratase family protein [Actinomyces sp. MRS3W]|uniref:NAD-dependent epimerase/dehydratase family protein n=1 Tax=Actinomyces sp. MRS3W TaxID=2800796 RepID=UPI0028FD0579|nr:NAD-dependent epimerase/dehydratase family protein [Actinomyces sp. MRS3W]MDU0348000.1 NAD-dependent epimerase/dehydratase family protein [Actinomyces sp. MRS3W]
MKAVVIGATGHIGTYLVPMLVRAGYEVTAVSRGLADPYEPDPAWNRVQRLRLDRAADPEFARTIAELDAEVVVDLIAFTPDQVAAMVTALAGTRLTHYLVASSIWAMGRSLISPVREDHPRDALDQYGRDKTAVEDLLTEQWLQHGFPATIVRPGQISGPGWLIISPTGNTGTEVFQRIADGEEIVLPNFGMEELHHVHGYDVAQVFACAIAHRNQALGEAFHAVADDALTTYGYAEAMYRFFGREPQITLLGWERWVEESGASEEEVQATYLHLARSGYFSNEKAKRLLGFQPRYTTLQTVEAAVRSYVERGVITATLA